MRFDVNDFIGKKNNRLTVVGFIKPEGKGRAKLKCLCDCGKIKYCYPYQFSSGDVKSCGCLTGGKKGQHNWDNNRKTHGLSKNPFYKKWNDMVRRCYYPQEPAYKYYGQLGISVCDEWRHSPEKFILWCENTYPKEGIYSLDRIDGTNGYSPDNCRWATRKEQSNNLKNNRFVTINGETRCVTDWCTTYGISPGAVYKKVKKGCSFENAIQYYIDTKTASVD